MNKKKSLQIITQKRVIREGCATSGRKENSFSNVIEERKVNEKKRKTVTARKQDGKTNC